MEQTTPRPTGSRTLPAHQTAGHDELMVTPTMVSTPDDSQKVKRWQMVGRRAERTAIDQAPS